ncbi:hypothetical protein RJ55_02472 [Drechmeria coniospora]|nr:hypothetical protein RJ55_02472 [Drechmeria coniospora]
MKPIFDSLVSDRNYVLILHGGERDKTFLETFDIVSNAVFTFDTAHLSQCIMGLFDRRKLNYILNELGVAYRNLHCGGNDANYTLKAFLMLAVKDFKTTSTNPRWRVERLFNRMQAIAQVPYWNLSRRHARN